VLWMSKTSEIITLWQWINEITWIQFTLKQKPKGRDRYWVHESLPCFTKQRSKISSKKDLLIISACNLYYYQKNRVAWSSNTMNKFSKSCQIIAIFRSLSCPSNTVFHIHACILTKNHSSSFILLIYIIIYSNGQMSSWALFSSIFNKFR